MSGAEAGWRANIRDAFELFILPGCVALFPARAGFALSRFLSRLTFLYRREAGSALALASRWRHIDDPSDWLASHRLMRLRDHADLFLWLWRRESWFRSRVTVSGSWPEATPFIAVTFHWGNGHWGLHSLRAATGGFAGVAAAPQREHFPGRPIQFRYASLRTQATADILGAGLVFPGAAARHLATALRRKVAICGLFDVPARADEKALDIVVQGQVIRMPRGFPRFAALHQIPIVTFSCAPDHQTGGSRVVIDPPQVFADERAAADYLGRRLNSLIASEPAWWHHWRMMPEPPAPAAAPT